MNEEPAGLKKSFNPAAFSKNKHAHEPERPG